MGQRIVAVSDRPALASLVAGWLLDGFGNPAGRTPDEMTALILAPPEGPEETFVLFHDGVPVGTAGLAHQDLPTRPELTPWLAAVYVVPAFRGRGAASALVRRVEAMATAAGVRTLWLHTRSAEALYLRLGWHRIGVEQHRGHDVVLMRRTLTAPPA